MFEIKVKSFLRRQNLVPPKAPWKDVGKYIANTPLLRLCFLFVLHLQPLRMAGGRGSASHAR